MENNSVKFADLSKKSDFLSITHNALFPFFTTKDAAILRTTCKSAQITVADYPWQDDYTYVKHVASWKASFPNAKTAKLHKYQFISRKNKKRAIRYTKYDDLKYLKGIHTLDIRQCCKITDMGLFYLKGIHTLIMRHKN